MSDSLLTTNQRAEAVRIVGVLINRLESVQSHGEYMVERLRDRMTEDELRDFGWQFAGILLEPEVRQIHEAYQREVERSDP